MTEWSRPFTPYGAGGTTHVEWPSHKNASNTGWSAGRRNRDYDSDKRDDGKTLRVCSPKSDDDNTRAYDTDNRDDGKTWQGRASQHDDDETWKSTDGRTWRYGSDK